MIRRITRLGRRPAAEQAMLARAVVLLLLTRVSLWVRPFAAVRTALDRYGRRQGRVGQVPVHAVVWAVNAGSAVVPGSTCLTRALVAQALLRNVGHDSQLRLGVASDVSRGFEAHAWLEDGAGILIGAESAAGFTVLPDIDGR